MASICFGESDSCSTNFCTAPARFLRAAGESAATSVSRLREDASQSLRPSSRTLHPGQHGRSTRSRSERAVCDDRQGLGSRRFAARPQLLCCYLCTVTRKTGARFGFFHDDAWPNVAISMESVCVVAQRDFGRSRDAREERLFQRYIGRRKGRVKAAGRRCRGWSECSDDEGRGTGVQPLAGYRDVRRGPSDSRCSPAARRGGRPPPDGRRGCAAPQSPGLE